MQKFLFLDFDGVLNSGDWSQSDEAKDWNGFLGFDIAKIRLVEEIIEKTGCFVVISSSWRIRRSLEEIKNILSHFGMKNTDCIIDKTGSFSQISDKMEDAFFHQQDAQFDHWDRGLEIFDWLLCNAPENCTTSDFDAKVSGIAILDDDSDMWRLSHKLVQTSWKTGLQPEHVEKVCALLDVNQD